LFCTFALSWERDSNDFFFLLPQRHSNSSIAVKCIFIIRISSASPRSCLTQDIDVTYMEIGFTHLLDVTSTCCIRNQSSSCVCTEFGDPPIASVVFILSRRTYRYVQYLVEYRQTDGTVIFTLHFLDIDNVHCEPKTNHFYFLPHFCSRLTDFNIFLAFD